MSWASLQTVIKLVIWLQIWAPSPCLMTQMTGTQCCLWGPPYSAIQDTRSYVNCYPDKLPLWVQGVVAAFYKWIKPTKTNYKPAGLHIKRKQARWVWKRTVSFPLTWIFQICQIHFKVCSKGILILLICARCQAGLNIMHWWEERQRRLHEKLFWMLPWQPYQVSLGNVALCAGPKLTTGGHPSPITKFPGLQKYITETPRLD